MVHLFLLLNNIPLYECISVFLFVFCFFLIHSPIEGHLGCFQLGWLYYTAPPNSHVQVFVGA